MSGQTWEIPSGFIPIYPGVDYTPPPIPSVDGPAQHVLKIPVAGPAPFNTLAVVRGRGAIGSGLISDDEMHRTVWRVSTHLKIPSYDPDRPVLDQLRHSTAASIVAMSSGGQIGIEHDDGSDFQVAVDEIVAEPYVDEDTKRFYVDIRTANLHNQTSSVDYLEMTSWVLYYDPATKPLDEQIVVIIPTFPDPIDTAAVIPGAAGEEWH